MILMIRKESHKNLATLLFVQFPQRESITQNSLGMNSCLTKAFEHMAPSYKLRLWLPA